MKPIVRSTKSPRGRSPERKMSSSRKTAPSRPPLHGSGSSRPPIPRGRSPNVKHRPSPHLRKTPHHPRPPMSSRRSRSPQSIGHGSPVPIDRVHASKFVKKTKTFSRSPPPSRHGPPLHGGRPRNGSMPSSDFDAPKKKLRRMSPGQRPPEKSMHVHPDNRMPHRSVAHPDVMYTQDRDREYSSAHAHGRPTFAAAGHSQEGYNSTDRSHPRNVAEASYSRTREREDYISDREKHYGPTLDERFRSFGGETGRGPEHRIQFSRADLENITIDVKRGMRETSPTVRRIMNPSDVKLVRRSSEGHRPIFDREEIKHSSRDLREDPYNERSDRHYGLNYKELENYEITRHKFDTYRGPPLPPAGAYTLGDKWQMFEAHKSSATSLDRDERSRGYPHRSRTPVPYVEKARMQRSHSTDRDFRSERYPSGPNHRSRPDYLDSRRPLPNNPADLRHSLAVKRKDGTLHDARQRILEKKNSGHEHPPAAHDYQHYPGPSRRPPESSSDRMRERRSISPVHRMEPSRSHADSYARDRSMDRGRPREDKMSDFSQRSDKYKYSWMEKSDTMSKGSNYYEHDSYEGMSGFRGRGNSRSFRPRNFRGRFFRGGPLRGSSLRSRGSFRGSSAPRGRGGYPPRRGRRYSPSLWEHDMYDKALQDR